MNIVNICLLILASLLLIGLSVYGLKHDFSLIAPKEMLRKDLVRWQVFGDSYPSPDVLVDVRKSWRYLRVMMLLGGGVMGMLVAICIVVISQRTLGLGGVLVVTRRGLGGKVAGELWRTKQSKKLGDG